MIYYFFQDAYIDGWNIDKFKEAFMYGKSVEHEGRLWLVSGYERIVSLNDLHRVKLYIPASSNEPLSSERLARIYPQVKTR